MRMMKRIGLSSIPLVLMTVSTNFAQVQHEIAVTRSEIQTERQAIVADNLPLTEEQAKAFWPLYRTYRGELATLGDRLVSLIENYAKSYETMTDVQAQAMLDDFLAIQRDEVKIKTAWVPKFGKVLPGKPLARFFQIENKLDAIVRFDLAAEVPLVQHGPKGQ